MSDEGRVTTTPTPWVLDVSVLTAIARADPEVTYLVIALDGRGHPLIIPALAITAASTDAGTEDGGCLGPRAGPRFTRAIAGYQLRKVTAEWG